jgi:hypothetical protein
VASESAASVPVNAALRRSLWRRVAILVASFLVAYWLITYLFVPLLWKRYYVRHPALENSPRITHTGDGHPGDPLNVALVGAETDLKAIMRAASWTPAAGLGLKSDLKIGVDTVLDRPDINAPVSNLFLFGRKEDLAFERPVGDNPKKRNHVRFWKTDKPDADGRPLWIGAATYDERVGLSHTTGQITHHVSPDVDVERDRLFADLAKSGHLSEKYFVDDYHTIREGKNGGGDPWHTDGRLAVGVIAIKGSRN